ncbi:Regulator of telomere elongation helicase 1, variant 2 [Balamuthia mandrillaris]
MCILGSRKQMCIHPQVSLAPGDFRDHKCRSLVSSGSCNYFNNVKENIGLGQDIADIEDLVRIGHYHEVCPYYLSRELEHSADIVFAPYNYLIDPAIRRSLGIDLHNTILVFDEAHNLESICEEVASLDFRVSDLQQAIKELDICISAVSRSNYVGESDKGELLRVQRFFGKLIQEIQLIRLPSGEQKGLTMPGDFIYELLEKVEITDNETADLFVHILEKATADLAEDDDLSSAKKTSVLKQFNDCLKTLYRDASRNDFRECFKVHVHVGSQPTAGPGNRFNRLNQRTLSCWCFSAGVAMRDLIGQGVRNVIVTSGTLAPLDFTAQELTLPFPIRLENKHVIQSSQIFVGILGAGPSGYPLNSSFKTRAADEYKRSLGEALANFSRIVPNGLLVFFPSYSVLSSCVEYWKGARATSTDSNSIWSRITKYKQPVMEPRESFQFNLAMEDYYSKVADEESGGAVFFAVCRGKVSEGLDFADNNGRAVVVTGLPFPSLYDARVELKRIFLDEKQRAAGGHCLGGKAWYTQQASRAVNQAVGRVIRHNRDYGAILLCDERFSYPVNLCGLSAWLRPCCRSYSSFGEAALALNRFFQSITDNPHVMLKPTSANDASSFSSSSSSLEPLAVPSSTTTPSTPKKPFQTPFRAPRTDTSSSSSSSAGATPQNASSFHNLQMASHPFNPPLSSVQPSPGGGTNDPKNNARAYIRQVKSSVAPEEYKEFQAMLRDFKSKSLRLQNLMSKAQQLFSTPERRSLLVDFITFIPRKHQPKYQAMLDQSAQAAVSPLPAPPLVATAASPKRGTASVDLITGQRNTPTKKPRLLHPSLQKNDSQPSANPASLSSSTSTSLSTTTTTAIATTSTDQPSSSTQQQEFSSRNFLQCSICQDAADSPSAARCGHICCAACWQKWLSTKLECPVCRRRTRLKQLTRLHISIGP